MIASSCIFIEWLAYVAAAVVIAISVYSVSRSWKRAVLAALVPAICAAYGGVVGQRVSEWRRARGFDIGGGDLWKAPIGGDWYLCMIDTTSAAFLIRGGCGGGSDLDAVARIQRVRANVFVGECYDRSGLGFTLDTDRNKIERYPNTAAAALAVGLHSPHLMTVSAFYYNEDHEQLGTATGWLMVVPWLLFAPTIFVTVRFIRRRRSATAISEQSDSA